MKILAGTLAGAAALALAAGVAVPAVAAPVSHAAPVTDTRPATPPLACAAGYAGWYLVVQGLDYFLHANGMGAAVTVESGLVGCWHAPPSTGSGTFTDNSGNCLDYNHGAGLVVMAKCDGANSEVWIAESVSGGAVDFQNLYAALNGQPDTYLAVQSPFDGDGDLGVLSPYPNGTLSRWFHF